MIGGPLVKAFGWRDAMMTWADLQRRNPSVRFRRGGTVLHIARDGNVVGTVHHLLTIESLARLADVVSPSDTIVLDGGAHSGLFSTLVKQRNATAQVIAVEPNPDLQSVIRQNLEPYDNWVLVPKALDAEPGIRTLYRNHDATQLSALSRGSGEVYGSSSVEAISVPSTTIDSLTDEFALDRIDVLKLDIQGAEGRAIAGAHKTLPRVQKLLIEVTFLEEGPEDLLLLLREEFGEPRMVQPVLGGADLLYARANV